MPLGYSNHSNQLDYHNENGQSPRQPQSASGNMRIGIKNTFIEVMPPVAVQTQRAVTSPGEMEHGASSSFDHHNQQQQLLDPQQQTGDAQQTTAAYFDPNTGACNFGVPVQMVPVPYMTSQDGYPMQFVDPSAFQQSSDGDMPYGFSQQGFQFGFVPMTQCGFVPMQQSIKAPNPTSMDEQNGSNNFDNQQYYNKGPFDKSQYGNGNTKDKRPAGGRKQKETQSSTNVNDGPKAVLVDLSKLRPVRKGDSVDWNTARLPTTSSRQASGSSGRNGWYKQ